VIGGSGNPTRPEPGAASGGFGGYSDVVLGYLFRHYNEPSKLI